MNKLCISLLIYILGFWASQSAFAQKISSSPLPKTAVFKIPASYRSYFWGTFYLKNGGPLFGIHIYDPNWKINAANAQKCGKHMRLFADIFQADRSWKRIRHCSLLYYGFIAKVMQTEIKLLWFDSKKTAPMFKIRSFENGAGAGDEILLTFPTGIARFYAAQSFTVGYWRASNSLGMEMFYDKRDKNGRMQLVSGESLNDDDNPQQYTLYIWDGKRFMGGKTVIRRGNGKFLHLSP